MDITLLSVCALFCVGDVRTHEAHVTGWGSTESGSLYLRPPEESPMAITERMKICERVQVKWVWSPLCLWVSVWKSPMHVLLLTTQTNYDLILGIIELQITVVHEYLGEKLWKMFSAVM